MATTPLPVPTDNAPAPAPADAGLPVASPPNFDTWYQPQPPTPAPAAPAADPAQPQPRFDPASQQWFLEAPTGTRYRTPEDAVAGIAEKDRTIQQYKSQLDIMRQALGGQQPQAAPPSYMDVMEQAINQGQPQLFDQRIQSDIKAEAQRLVQEALGPMTPLVGYANLTRAARLAAVGPQGDPNIPAFVESAAFQSAIKAEPELGGIIQYAMNDPKAADQLPGLIRSLYRLARASAPAAPAPPPIPARMPAPNSSAPAQPTAPTGQGVYDRVNFFDISADEWAAANASRRP